MWQSQGESTKITGIPESASALQFRETLPYTMWKSYSYKTRAQWHYIPSIFKVDSHDVIILTLFVC